MKYKIGFFQRHRRRWYEIIKPDMEYRFVVAIDGDSSDITTLIDTDREYVCETGEILVFDAHGIWLTKTESAQLFDPDGTNNVEWCTDESPIFPPK